jgi:hypothetical protein
VGWEPTIVGRVSEHQSSAEGWYRDPFGTHEARWFSDGTATALVRDGEVEAHDPPPDVAEGVEGTEPEELPEEATSPLDTLRADDAEVTDGGDSRTPAEAALDAFPQSGNFS